MKVHTFNEGDLAAKMDLVYGVPYFKRFYISLEGCKKRVSSLMQANHWLGYLPFED